MGGDAPRGVRVALRAAPGAWRARRVGPPGEGLRELTVAAGDDGDVACAWVAGGGTVMTAVLRDDRWAADAVAAAGEAASPRLAWGGARRLACLFVLGTGAALASGGEGAWEVMAFGAFGRRPAGRPALAGSDDGWLAAWTVGGDAVVAARGGPGGWREPREVAPPGAGAAAGCQVALPSRGAVAAWVRSGGTIEACVADGRGGWAAPVRVGGAATGATTLRLASCADGAVTAVWTTAGGTLMSATRDGGFRAGPLATSGWMPRIASRPDGRPVVAWIGDDHTIHAARAGAGGAWEPPRPLTGPGGAAEGPDVAAGPHGAALAAWRTPSGAVRARLADGAAWGDVEEVAPPGSAHAPPCAAVLDDGTALVAWIGPA